VNNIATETITPASLAGLKVQKVQMRSRYLNVLVYGKSGLGKTTLAGSADAVPSMRPVLFVDVEGGTESLRHSYPDVDVVRVTTWEEMQALYNELHSGRTEYQTVVIDSLTEVQKFNMYTLMKKVVEEHPDRELEVPSVREWGISLEQLRRFVRGFRDLPMNVIFTALEKGDQDKRSGLTIVKPSLNGKLADEAAAFLDIVLYYYIKRVTIDGEQIDKRFLLSGATDTHIAKDRTGKLPNPIEDPTMKVLVDAINGKASTNTNNTTHR
jgi:hypothetical protein